MEIGLDKNVVCPVLIGRTPYLDSFARLTEQIDGGEGKIVLISGEAGVGKSRLASELQEHVRSAGWQVQYGTCTETDRGFPYAPLLDLLRAHFAQLSPQEIEEELDHGASPLPGFCLNS